MTNRVLLCIMDGWGISTGSEKYDATKRAHPVNAVSYTHLYKRKLLKFELLIYQ